MRTIITKLASEVSDVLLPKIGECLLASRNNSTSSTDRVSVNIEYSSYPANERLVGDDPSFCNSASVADDTTEKTISSSGVLYFLPSKTIPNKKCYLFLGNAKNITKFNTSYVIMFDSLNFPKMKSFKVSEIRSLDDGSFRADSIEDLGKDSLEEIDIRGSISNNIVGDFSVLKGYSKLKKIRLNYSNAIFDTSVFGSFSSIEEARVDFSGFCGNIENIGKANKLNNLVLEGMLNVNIDGGLKELLDSLAENGKSGSFIFSQIGSRVIQTTGVADPNGNEHATGVWNFSFSSGSWTCTSWSKS